mgnify:CR=1 FL=1
MIRFLGLKANPEAIAEISMLGSTDKISWSQNANELIIKPSARYPSDYAVVYKILFKKQSGKP